VTHLFVYGTLKRGESNHELLTGQHFVGEAVTEPLYRLLDCGGYPALIESAKGLPIRGEVYLVDESTLRTLDVLEEAPHLFRLSAIRLRHFTEPVRAYLFQQDASHYRECGDNWADPDT
jgi:gamma-glutamylcyclotransferase (GGCT)/AIG2-like uncharacterized protein YtfP